MDLFFAAFLKDKKSDLRGIARRTHGEMSIQDVENEAWIIAQEIESKRGYPIDFSDPDEHKVVLSWLSMQCVTRKHSINRYAARLDYEHDHDDGAASSLLDRLKADDVSDPLIRIIQEQDSADAEALLAASYSQAAAYVAVFFCFRYDRDEICAYLVISDATLMSRIQFAILSIYHQSSLFDGIERIDESFMPRRGRQRVIRPEHQLVSTQSSWNF